MGKEEGKSFGIRPEKESPQALISLFRDQVASNLQNARISPSEVRGARIIPVIPDERIAEFLSQVPDFQMKVAVVSLSDKPLPEVSTLSLLTEDLYYGEVCLEMYKDFGIADPFLVLKPLGKKQDSGMCINYKQSVKPALHFTEGSDIPLGIQKGQRKEAEPENEALLAFFWKPGKNFHIAGSIVMPRGFEEMLKNAGIMDSEGKIDQSYLHFETDPNEGKIPTVRSAAEIRAGLEKRYGWILPYYIRYKSPAPDPVSQPEEHKLWEQSRRIVNYALDIYEHGDAQPYESDDLSMNEIDVLMEGESAYKVQEILERLNVDVVERLIEMAEQREKTHYVESPTNAKQTVRAIRQVDQRISQVVHRDPTDYSLKLDELTGQLEAGGGWTSDGQYVENTPEEIAEIERQVAELTGDILMIKPGSKLWISLQTQKQRWLDLLPSHVRAKYESERQKTDPNSVTDSSNSIPNPIPGVE